MELKYKYDDFITILMLIEYFRLLVTLIVCIISLANEKSYWYRLHVGEIKKKMF